SSPFHYGKTRLRLELLQHHVQKWRRPFIFTNQVGGNDEVLFDGHSVALDRNGGILARACGFQEEFRIVDTSAVGTLAWEDSSDIAQIRDALVMGLRDYTRKCGFKKVVLGLSGGIDSAVTAALAVEALGPANVLGVSMPSPFSSKGSVLDAQRL